MAEAEYVAQELHKFIESHLSQVEDAESIREMSFEDCEKCLKLLLASQIQDDEKARFVCSCIDPNRVHGLEYFRGVHLDPKFYRYVFDNVQVNASSECLRHFERVAKISGSPQRLLRVFHAQNVSNFRDEVLDIANGHVTIGNQLYTTLRGISQDREAQPSKELVADLWQYDVHFPFFKDGRVVLVGHQQVIIKEEEEEDKDHRVAPVPLANTLDLATKEALLERMEPVLVRYCVENRLPKHFWHYDFTVNQCLQVALGSTVTDLHRDQTTTQKFKVELTQQELATLVEYHMALHKDSSDISHLCQHNVQSRLYYNMVHGGGNIIKNPRSFLAGLIARHQTSFDTLPDVYKRLCPDLEPVLKDLTRK
jgi:hypothetical protein